MPDAQSQGIQAPRAASHDMVAMRASCRVPSRVIDNGLPVQKDHLAQPCSTCGHPCHPPLPPPRHLPSRVRQNWSRSRSGRVPSPQYQRAGRYLPASSRHPGNMLPELARRLVAEYRPPAGLVIDPMCGIGTTLVEAAALGRRAVGVELEPRWAQLARANLAHALPPHLSSLAEVQVGDARQLPELLGNLAGRADLLVTSPPYACDAGVIDKPAWQAGQPLCPKTPSTTRRIRPTSAAPAASAGGPASRRSWPAAPDSCAQVGYWSR